MKRPKTRVAKAIALRSYHTHMRWIHELASNKYPWKSEYNKKYAKFLLGKQVEKPEYID